MDLKVKAYKQNKKKKQKKFKKIVNKTIEDIEKVIPLDYSLTILEGFTVDMINNPNIAGLYITGKNTIVISPLIPSPRKEEEVRDVLLHEVGHSVHYNYLQYKAQYIRRKHKGDTSYYCNSNQKESFAECFKDYINAYSEGKFKKIENSPRLSKMGNILKTLKE